MTNDQARRVLQSLRGIFDNLWMRERRAQLHDEFCLMHWMLPKRDVNWLYDFRIPGLKLETQQTIVEAANLAGFYCRPGFRPLSLMDEYREQFSQPSGIRESVSEVLSREVIALDCSPESVSGKAIERVWELIHRTVRA